LPFPIDLLRRPYNSVALPCDTVIGTYRATCPFDYLVFTPA